MYSHDGLNCQFSLAGVHGEERVCFYRVDGGNQHSVPPVVVSQDVKTALADGKTSDNKDLFKDGKHAAEVAKHETNIRGTLYSKDQVEDRIKILDGDDSVSELTDKIKENEQIVKDAKLYGLSQNQIKDIEAVNTGLAKEIDTRNDAARQLSANYKNQTSLIGTLEFRKDQIEAEKTKTVDATLNRGKAILERLFDKDYDRGDVEAVLLNGRANWDNSINATDDPVRKALFTQLKQTAKDYREHTPKSFDDRIDDVQDEIDDIKDVRHDVFEKLTNDQQSELNDSIHAHTGKPEVTSPTPKPADQDRPKPGANAAPKPAAEPTKPDANAPANDAAAGVPKPKVHVAAEIVAQHGGLDRTYTVKRGDSYWRIADNYNKSYGTNLSWQDIYTANKDQAVVVKGTAYIYTGQVFKIPGIGEKIDHDVAVGNAWESAAYQQAVEAAKHSSPARSTPAGGLMRYR